MDYVANRFHRALCVKVFRLTVGIPRLSGLGDVKTNRLICFVWLVNLSPELVEGECRVEEKLSAAFGLLR